MQLATTVVLASCAMLAAGLHDKVVFHSKQFIELGKDCGRAKSCFGSRQNFTLEFFPNIITFGKPLKLSFSFTPRVTLKEGKICYTVNVDQPMDTEPILQECQSLHCDRIDQLFPTMCPFRKGVTAQGTEALDLREFAPYVPPGKYKARVEVISTAGEKVLCIELHFQVVATPDSDEYEYN